MFVLEMISASSVVEDHNEVMNIRHEDSLATDPVLVSCLVPNRSLTLVFFSARVCGGVVTNGGIVMGRMVCR